MHKITQPRETSSNSAGLVTSVNRLLTIQNKIFKVLMRRLWVTGILKLRNIFDFFVEKYTNYEMGAGNIK